MEGSGLRFQCKEFASPRSAVPAPARSADRTCSEKLKCGRTLRGPVPGLDRIYGQDVLVFSAGATGTVLNIETIPQSAVSIIAGLVKIRLAEPRHGIILRELNFLYVPDDVVNARVMLKVTGDFLVATTSIRSCGEFSRSTTQRAQALLRVRQRIKPPVLILTDQAERKCRRASGNARPRGNADLTPASYRSGARRQRPRWHTTYPQKAVQGCVYAARPPIRFPME